jgi:hypothetical protein
VIFGEATSRRLLTNPTSIKILAAEVMTTGRRIRDVAIVQSMPAA